MSARTVIAVLAAGACGLAAGALLLGRGAGEDDAAQPADPDDLAVAASRHFLEAYVAPDGRVVRHDQGGDTVSEGQAYAMLIAVAVEDDEAFALAWEWAAENLRRPDGLFSSHWVDGEVVDPEPAADADLDIARALLLAAERFDRPEYREEGMRVAGAVLAHEVYLDGDRPVLAAGPWAVGDATVNPSYFDPRTYAALGEATGDPRWGELAVSSREILARLSGTGPGLPPDWARVGETGAEPVAAPSDPAAGPRYGYEAVRVPVRYAASCAPADRELAARPWPFLSGESGGGGIDAAYGLDGTVAETGAHPAGLVGAAAAAGASGDTGARDALLAQAGEADAASPSYYGAAWVALGRLMLTTDRLGAC